MSDSEMKPGPNAREFAIVFWSSVLGVPAATLSLHMIWPELVWLRAFACGLVVVPGVLLLNFVFVRVTFGKGSILNGWAIILPFIAGLLSDKYGWAAPVWVLGGLAILYTVGIAYFWIVRGFARRSH